MARVFQASPCSGDSSSLTCCSSSRRWRSWGRSSISARRSSSTTSPATSRSRSFSSSSRPWARRISSPGGSLARSIELTEGAQRIADGDFGHEIHVSGSGHHAALAATFNAMRTRLAATFDLVEHDREQLRAILSGMVEGVIAIDDERRILFANEKAGELLGLRSKAVTQEPAPRRDATPGVHRDRRERARRDRPTPRGPRAEGSAAAKPHGLRLALPRPRRAGGGDRARRHRPTFARPSRCARTSSPTSRTN